MELWKLTAHCAPKHEAPAPPHCWYGPIGRDDCVPDGTCNNEGKWDKCHTTLCNRKQGFAISFTRLKIDESCMKSFGASSWQQRWDRLFSQTNSTATWLFSIWNNGKLQNDWAGRCNNQYKEFTWLTNGVLFKGWAASVGLGVSEGAGRKVGAGGGGEERVVGAGVVGAGVVVVGDEGGVIKFGWVWVPGVLCPPTVSHLDERGNCTVPGTLPCTCRRSKGADWLIDFQTGISMHFKRLCLNRIFKLQEFAARFTFTKCRRYGSQV